MLAGAPGAASRWQRADVVLAVAPSGKSIMAGPVGADRPVATAVVMLAVSKVFLDVHPAVAVLATVLRPRETHDRSPEHALQESCPRK